MSSISSVGSGLVGYLSKMSSGRESATGGSAAGAVQSIFGKQKHRGGHGAMQKLQETVTNALQAAKASGSTADPNKTIQDAISKILKGFGTSASGGTASDSDSDSDSSTAADSTTGTSFADVLKSFGVTSDDFQNDFQSAIKNVMSDASNPSKSYGNSLASGSLLDALG